MKIAIAADHAGYEYKNNLVKYFTEQSYEVKDFGPSSDASMDYPDTAHPLALAVEKGDFDFGITICGSGNGITMTANKHMGIRAALCWTEEISELSRLHNDANICGIPARFISYDECLKIVLKFINTKFEGGRHLTRVKKISDFK